MIQARQSGVVMVFRGLIGGTLRNTQQFLGELAKENVSAIIDPRLFEVFNVELVPTFVVLAKPSQDCEESSCNFTPNHDRIAGNITLNYALEQFAEGHGDAKSQASEILAKLQAKAQNQTQNLGGQK
jgi:conjugal transfer pilus assembly protein TrbC